MNGWIKIHRKLLEWEWYDDPNTFRLFMHLLLLANHKPRKYRGITIETGQVMTGLGLLAEQTGLSIRSVRTCLKRLKSTSEVTIKTSSKGSIIQIVKYKDYQITTSEVTNERQTNDKQTTTNKNVKKENKNIPTLEEFMLFAKSKLNDTEYSLKRQNLIFKYQAWVANDWHDGNNKKIKRWKAKLLHTLPHIEKSYKQQKL